MGLQYELMLQQLLNEAPSLLPALAIFAVAIPIELLFGTGRRAQWSERMGNIGAMLLHFAAGGLLLNAMLAQPWGILILGFPETPRTTLLQNPIVWTIALIFVTDGLFYIYHRLQHAVPLLWHVHKLHHTDPEMNITTSKRSHFLERPLQFIVFGAPALWITGVNYEGLAYATVCGPFFLYFAHLDLRLPLGPLTAIIVGPQYHRIHHSKAGSEQNANFAQAFPLFDMLGGTYKRPAQDEYPDTGVLECNTATKRWTPLIW
jgi:sterol desaturase/sphingolipid hydroxylase (fatty acid hydroxylase superfamily)